VTRLLDTTLLIDYAAGRPEARDLIEQFFAETEDLLVCDAVVAEALSRGTDEERGVIEALISALEYVSTSPEAARWAGDARRRAGRDARRHLGDALIAGVAQALGATVVTRNPDDFVRMGVPVLGY
jgi:predicted nucleic acid-binding protein